MSNPNCIPNRVKASWFQKGCYKRKTLYACLEGVPLIEKCNSEFKIEAYFEGPSDYSPIPPAAFFKRGYRRQGGAPIKENMGAAILRLSNWYPDKPCFSIHLWIVQSSWKTVSFQLLYGRQIAPVWYFWPHLKSEISGWPLIQEFAQWGLVKNQSGPRPRHHGKLSISMRGWLRLPRKCSKLELQVISPLSNRGFKILLEKINGHHSNPPWRWTFNWWCRSDAKIVPEFERPSHHWRLGSNHLLTESAWRFRKRNLGDKRIKTKII